MVCFAILFLAGVRKARQGMAGFPGLMASQRAVLQLSCASSHRCCGCLHCLRGAAKLPRSGPHLQSCHHTVYLLYNWMPFRATSKPVVSLWPMGNQSLLWLTYRAIIRKGDRIPLLRPGSEVYIFTGTANLLIASHP